MKHYKFIYEKPGTLKIKNHSVISTMANRFSIFNFLFYVLLMLIMNVYTIVSDIAKGIFYKSVKS